MIFLQTKLREVRDKKGFTLIELLTAVAIIAVLTAVVTANFRQARMKSRDAKRIADIKNIQLALQSFFDRCRSYPETLNIADTAGDTCPDGVTLGSFITRIPIPPAGSLHPNYNYARYSEAGYPGPIKYHIGAELEDVGNPYLLEDEDFTSLNADGWYPGFIGNDPRYDLFP